MTLRKSVLINMSIKMTRTWIEEYRATVLEEGLLGFRKVGDFGGVYALFLDVGVEMKGANQVGLVR